MARIYGAGAAMGFSPQQVNAMSMWQFFAAFDGWVEANSPKADKLSETEADELFAWIDDGPADVAPGPVWVFDDDGQLVKRD